MEIYLARYTHWDLDTFRAEYLDHLNPAEQQRLAAFKNADASHQFLIGRVLLRQCLANKLQRAPAQFDFLTTEQGRPFLADTALDFNLSHTTGVVALIVGQHPQVGIDIENTHRGGALLEIAVRFFHPKEHPSIRALADASAQNALFFRLWTLKEAYVKAMGSGLQRDLSSFYFSLGQDFKIDLQDFLDNHAQTHCQMYQYRLWEDFICACVHIGQQETNQSVTLFTLNEQLETTPLAIAPESQSRG